MNKLFALSRTLLPMAALYRQQLELPNRLAITDGTMSITYDWFLTLVKQTAAQLVELGVKPGDRIILISSNNPVFPIIIYATSFVGAIIVPVNFRLAEKEIKFIASDCKATVVIHDTDREAAVRTACKDLNSFVIDLNKLITLSRRSENGDTLLTATNSLQPYIPNPGDDQAIMYTSGTTGEPKGAVLTYENFITVVSRVTADWNCEVGQAVFYIMTPLFHIGAFDFVLTALANGETCVIAQSAAFNAATVLDDMERYKITHTYFVPVQMQQLIEEQRARPRKLDLKFYAWGAAPASEKLLTDMRNVFPDSSSQATFGQTETSGLGVTMTHRDSILKCGAVGRPDRFFAIRVVDDEMKDVPLGAIGEIVYRGPGVMDRYWENQEGTELAFRGGWFHSGDLVRRDKDGFIYVVDRLKDMIISGGENIYSAELENVIALFVKVRYVAVIGKRDDRWGEIPVALIVPKDMGNPPTLNEINKFCEGKIAHYKLPKQVIVYKEFPRNATGKIRKNLLRDHINAMGDRD